MPALFVFLLKVNIALIIFCLGYFLVLRRLTFYTLNRIYLVIAIVFSSAYPLIDISNFALRHQQIAQPVQNVIVSWKTPAENLVKPIIDYWYWAETIFWMGAAVFAVKLLIQLISLFKLYKRSKPGRIQDQDVRIVDADISPFSFWQSIYINPHNLNNGDLQSILQHEQIHVKEWHTIDVLLTEISVIFYWFNPGVWLMKKAVRENIEFITDRKILQKGTDSKEYQYSLLNVSFASTAPAGIINHFNFSTLKKRIQMMNAKRSSNVNLTRYAFLVPTVIILLFAISLSKAELVKKSKIAYKTITASVHELSPAAIINTIVITPAKKAVNKVKVADTVKKLQEIYVTTSSDIKGDTSRRIMIATTKNGTDSISAYMLNGVKVSKEELKKLVSEGVITGNNNIDRKDVVIRLTESLTGHTNSPKGEPMSIRVKSLTGDSTHTIRLTGRGVSNISKQVKEVRVDNYTYVTTDPKTSRLQITSGNGTISGTNFVFKNSNEKSIDNFSGKLFVIDGKVATDKEKKKLSVTEIASMVVDDKKELVNKYGDQARDGVVFITTKAKN